MKNRSVALVDDHPLMIDAIVNLISHSTNLTVVAVGTKASDIIDICGAHKPSTFIVDLGLAGDVYAAISKATQLSPDTQIIAFTASTTVDTAIRALDAGAKSYVLKGSSADELITALECAERGETYITQSFASRVIAALRDSSFRRKAAEAVKLSIRENQIVRLLLRGKTNREIAVSLKISEKTVKHYMTVLMQKLQARNRIEVVLAAQKLAAPDLIGLQASQSH